jgi:multidrug efflux pump subunit AcrB
MRLPRLAIQNHQFTLVLVVLLLALGAVSFFTMPRSEDPAVSPAGFNVFVVYPGATPVDIEELIVEPIEQAVNEIDDIKRLDSNAEDGIGIVSVEFHTGVDVDEKYSEFVQKINSVRNELPPDILAIELLKWSITDVNILQLALISESEEYRSLEEEAEQLKKMLEKAPGVRGVDLHAVPQQEVRVALDLEKLAAYHIPMNQIIGSIQSSSQNIPGGYMDIGSKRFNIQTSGSYENIDDIKKTVIHAGNGRIVQLQDVADVKFAYQDDKYMARVNGRRAVFVTVQQKSGTNIFKVMDELEAKIKTFDRSLPSSISLDYVFHQGDSVDKRLNGFFMNLLQGLILVGIVVLFVVGYRAAAIVIIVIPFSLLIGIGFIDLTGFGLQQMSIAGLVIALGLLVDNAIVVTENISRFMRQGYSRFEAASQGTSQIGWAVVSSTATTVLAFVPMMMIQNVTGDFIRSMPLTVVYTLTASLVLSLTFTPYLSSKFLNVEKSSKRRTRLWLNNFVETHYRSVLKRALSRPVLVIVLALAIFFGSFALFPLVGVSFFPKAEKPQFMIDITTPKGSNISETDRVVREVEEILADMEHIKYTVANIGHGNPRIYYNVVPRRDRSTVAQIYVKLDEWDRSLFYNIIAELREIFASTAGAKIEVKEFEQGPHLDAPIVIRLIGDNIAGLETIARDIEDMFETTPGTINIRNPMTTSKTDVHININRDKAGMLGVPIIDIDRTIRTAVAGASISRFRDSEGKEYAIVVRLPFDEKFQFEDFNRIFVTSLSGASVPLASLATIEFTSTPMQIDHFNLERTVQIMSDVAEGFSVDDVTRSIIKKLDAYELPADYRYSIGGEFQSREESFGGMIQAIIVALVGIFAVLVLQFKSYSQPFIVFSAIPLAIIGAVLALLITGYSFSFTAFVGLTSLVGIVVNNSIILVDYTNKLLDAGKSVVDALQEACETRFIPIILTTATTVGGLLPLTLGGGSLWAPMGWTIIGGLLMSTWLTLIVVPVLFKVLTKEVGVQDN